MKNKTIYRVPWMTEWKIMQTETSRYNLPVFDRNHFLDVIVNTYTSDQR